MHWLYRNVNHLTVPLGMVCALFGAMISLRVRRQQRDGLPALTDKRGLRLAAILFLVGMAFLLGVAFVRNFA